MPKRLILLGGGHAHLRVLKHLIEHKPAELEVLLVSPSPWQYYSGMLPGLLAGDYALQDCRVDLASIARRAGVSLIIAAVEHWDAPQRLLDLSDGRSLSYDLLSVNTGSETQLGELQAVGDVLLPIKPLDHFYQRCQQLFDAYAPGDTATVAVVGGGAAGAEIAMAVQQALQTRSLCADTLLITGKCGVLAGHANAVKRRLRQLLQHKGIEVIASRARAIEPGRLEVGDKQLRVDLLIATTGARAPDWLKPAGVSLAKDGFIAVNACQQSLSHPEVFAVGDVASRVDKPLDKSGVHAVKAGGVLCHNLLAAAKAQTLKPYKPRPVSLYLLNTADGKALLSWGPLTAQGAWVLKWKHWLDSTFIREFNE
ncbi:FAD-dependent oxidoreductase [Nitrincola sp.]|uniref:FAD-dependent oxidoreductase n=1 Tax=Nitrincola sp. TaxID=1926584 RepID=UPI003A9577AB